MLLKGILINKTDDDLLLERVACESKFPIDAGSVTNKKIKSEIQKIEFK